MLQVGVKEVLQVVVQTVGDKVGVELWANREVVSGGRGGVTHHSPHLDQTTHQQIKLLPLCKDPLPRETTRQLITRISTAVVLQY